MPINLPIKPKWRGLFEEYYSIFLICAFFAGVMLLATYQNELRELFSARPVAPDAARPEFSAANPPAVVRPDSSPTPAVDGSKLPTIIRLGPNPTTVPTGSIDASRIHVVDGDTIRVDSQSYRLVGIDTPEGGLLAKCARERELGERATRRLNEIVASGGLRLDRVACAHCPPGSEGTPACNYGRFCGVLTASGRDVGLILIGEGLAKRYNCSATQCPPKQPWCT